MKRILVALDARLDEAAVLRRAAALGRAPGAALRLTSCISESNPASDALAEEAAAFGADLLVTGRPLSTTPGRPAFTASDWRLIGMSPCPVLITHGAADDGFYRDILVAVDPMHAHDRPAALDDALIAAAQELAAPGGARVRLLHCYLPAEYLPLRAPGAVSSAAFHRRDSSIEGHRDALQQLARRQGIAPGDVLLEPADARQAIPEAATRLGVDLVVMGAVARSRLRRLLIGSTAEAVLDRLPCDVLAINPAQTGR